MKLLRVGAQGSEVPAVLTEGGSLRDVSEFVPELSPEFLRDDDFAGVLDQVAQRCDELPELSADSRIGAPIAHPGKIICVGLNYRLHAAEGGLPVPDEPILFMKAPYTLQGPHDPVAIPPGSKKTDYEVELAIVVGKRARYLTSEDDALAYVAGYCISDDVSERAYQFERGGQWDKGKNCEGFNPLGPWFVTVDEVPDPQALTVELTVNGEVRQRSNTSDMIFSVRHLVWYISQFMVLLPGDIINTGTPSGVGMGFTPTRFLSAGDVVELSITGLGTQRHEFFRATPTSAVDRPANDTAATSLGMSS